MTSLLIDSGSRGLLVLGNSIPGIAFLNDCMPDTYHVPWAERPNYTDGSLTRDFRPAEFPEWRWVRRDRRLARIPPHALTDALRDKSALAVAKLRAFEQITHHLNTSRNRLLSGIHLQDVVYMTKFLEAMRFRESGYEEDRILEFPYVLQYAEFADIPLRQAADDIFLKARLDQHYLLNTEGLRLKYFAILKRADAPAALEGLVDAFRQECFANVMA